MTMEKSFLSGIPLSLYRLREQSLSGMLDTTFACKMHEEADRKVREMRLLIMTHPLGGNLRPSSSRRFCMDSLTRKTYPGVSTNLPFHFFKFLILRIRAFYMAVFRARGVPPPFEVDVFLLWFLVILGLTLLAFCLKKKEKRLFRIVRLAICFEGEPVRFLSFYLLQGLPMFITLLSWRRTHCGATSLRGIMKWRVLFII